MEPSRQQRVAHDLLLDMDPNHPADCRICAEAIADGGANVAEITKEDLDAAVTKAVSEVRSEYETKIADLESRLAARDTEDQVAELQKQLDDAVAQAKAATDSLDATVAYLAAVDAEQREAAERDARKAERVQAVADLGIFPEAHIEASADRWAAMDAEMWDAQLADYAAAKPATATAGAPAEPATEVKEPTPSPLSGRATDSDATTSSTSIHEVLSDRHAVLAALR